VFLWVLIMFEISLDTWDFKQVKLLEHETEQSLLSSADLKNVWKNTSSARFIFMER
jgi:hypothetical protein